MWEVAPKQTRQKETKYLLDWMNREVLREDLAREAEDLLIAAENVAQEIRSFRTTPQAANWHAEGPVISDHIRRILQVILAIVEGASLLEIEEFAREKILYGELLELEQTIREQAATMIVFALLHDLAKPDTLRFDAPQGSKGEKEGFRLHGQVKRELARPEEVQHYMKLYKSFAIKQGVKTTQEMTAAFFDTYEIHVHNHGHDRVGASDKYLEVRQRIEELHQLSADDAALMPFLIKHHIDALSYFKDGPNEKKFLLLIERANQWGFDADDALDALLAAAFLDRLGSLSYAHGQFTVQYEMIVHMLHSERLALPKRQEKRDQEVLLEKKRKRKAAMKEAGLNGESVFSLLETVYGKERGTVMKRINEMIDDPEIEIEFGEHSEEMGRRITHARSLLTEEVLT